MSLRLTNLCFSGCGFLKCLKSHSRPLQPYGVLFPLYTGMRQQPSMLCTNSVKENESRQTEDVQSWVHLLYNDNGFHNDSLCKLRRKLDVALTSTRSHEKGDLLPYLVAQDLVRFYESLVDLEEKAVLFTLLADKLGVDFNALLSKISQSQDTLQNNRLRYRYQQNLLNSLTPSYKHLFDDISMLQFGISFLVNMRKDLLTCFRAKHLMKTPALQSFDTCLKEHLSRWFANGFLDLEEVSWEKSSGQLLEKVMNYEAVHVMNDWEDIKSRAGRGRRIFTFSHRLMPDEPLVILHTLLGSEIPSNIQVVLSTPTHDVNVANINTATFYSVTSTQRGLDGIGLGNLLIKRVVEKLKNEFYNMSNFVTLSPIPGFKKWLDLQLMSVENSEEIPAQLQNIFNGGIEDLIQFKKHLSTLNWHENPELCEFLKEPLTLLCARYLIHTKRRGFASNPVAHFHLRNGACLWRINWLGNTNDYGIKSSYGFMANYKYNLNQLEENNNNYVQLGKIAVSQNVQKYLRD